MVPVMMRANAWRPSMSRRSRKKDKKTRRRKKEREKKREKERVRGWEEGESEGKPRISQYGYVLFAATNISFFSYLLSFPVPACYSTLFLFSLSMSLFLFSHFFFWWDKQVPTVARGTYAIPRMDTGGRGKFPKEARENIAQKKIYIYIYLLYIYIYGFANRVANNK